MSANLVQLADAHRAPGAPTVVELLSAAVRDARRADRRGHPRRRRRDRACRRRPSTASPPSTTTCSRRAGARHVRVCTGTACFAATGGAHDAGDRRRAWASRPAPAPPTARVSLAETVCLGFCHSAPAVRDGDVVDAGPGVVERVLAGTTRQAPEPPARSLLAEPVLTVAGDWSGAAPRARDAHARGAHRRRRGRRPARPRRRLVPRRPQVGVRPRRRRRAALRRRQRRRGRPGLVHRQAPHGAGARRSCSRAWRSPATRSGRREGFVLVRSEYPRVAPRARGRRSPRRAPAGCSGRTSSAAAFAFDVHVVDGAGSYVVGEETALLACLHGLRGTVSARPPFPAERGLYGRPTVVHNIETLANVPVDRRARRRASTATSARRARTRARSSSASTSASRAPASSRCRSGCRFASSARTSPAASWTGARSRRCRSAGRSAGSCPAALLDTPFDTAPLAEHGCMVGHGSILAFDDDDRHARARHAPARVRRARELRHVLPVPDRPASGRTRSSPPAPPSIASAWRRCSRRSRSRASARTAAGCPRRSAAS